VITILRAVNGARGKVAVKVDGNRFRQKRFAMFLALLDRAGRGEGPVRVLDIGGTVSYWRALEPLWSASHLDITVVNLGSEPSDDGIFHFRPGDARSLDYADNSFDVIHSNSVVEHVGHWLDMIAMAREVRRIAPHYYVQTPNFWFPIEPHFRTAFMHWYPESVRAAMLLRKKRGFHSADTLDTAMRNIQSANLLTARQMAALFPDAEILREKFGPLTKSLIAVR
jgi:2-polyprenyl-3-methyl-5-hydroxy-6-metoxy-1,4-benzoquinol methylase